MTRWILCMTIWGTGITAFTITEPNRLWIHNTSGSAQFNRPITIARPFCRGEIYECVVAMIDGDVLVTQCDVKCRWPDGSLQHAVVSFVVPALPAFGSVEVRFLSTACHDSTGGLSLSDMLHPSYDFDVDIAVVGSATNHVSARTMLADGNCRTWLQGPVVTAIVLEDRSTNRLYDIGVDHEERPLHPIVEAWFYPGLSNVSLGVTLENCWAGSTASNNMRDVSYAFSIATGHTNSTVAYQEGTFRHIARSRWHRRLWHGPDPPGIHIDHNYRYLVSTPALPPMDPDLVVANGLVDSLAEHWAAEIKGVAGDAAGAGRYEKHLTSGGQHDWVGLMNRWDAVYLCSMDGRLHDMHLGHADLAGRIPVHFREADTNAGTGGHFDAPFSGEVDTHGRVVSINARRSIYFDSLDWHEILPDDRIVWTNQSLDGWVIATSHLPDVAYLPYLLSGRYYYLEELHFWAAYALGWNNGTWGPSWTRQGEAGYFNRQVRSDAWSFRTIGYAAFITPDGWPEKDYFLDKLYNNIAKWEGEHELPLTLPDRQQHWDWGHANRRPSFGVSPLGFWQNRGADMVESPLVQNGTLAGGASPWEEGFLICALGMARQFGLPVVRLLESLARRPFNLVLNPDTMPYLVEAYRYPTIETATGVWIQDWSDVAGYYARLPTDWADETDADNGYGFIALGSIAFLYDMIADGYKGQDVWNSYYPVKRNKHLYTTFSPKFAYIPRTNSVPYYVLGPGRPEVELHLYSEPGNLAVLERTMNGANWLPVSTNAVWFDDQLLDLPPATGASAEFFRIRNGKP